MAATDYPEPQAALMDGMRATALLDEGCPSFRKENQSMIELKPCPHCGKKVDYAYNLDLEPYGIHCANCHMIVRFTRVKRPEKNEIFEHVLTDLAVRWNNRTEDSDGREKVPEANL